MIRKNFLLLIVALLAHTTVLSVAYADTLDVHLGVLSESKGVSGDLVPHFSSDPAVGGHLMMRWREYVLGLEVKQFAGLRSMFSTSGHTIFFASAQRSIGHYDAHVRYNYIHMKSMMPSWWPWNDDSCHELLVTIDYPHPQAGEWRLYALAGLAAAEGALMDTSTVIGGAGAKRIFPVNRRIDLTVDSLIAGYLLSFGPDRKIFARANGSFSFSLETLPLSFVAGLGVFKALGDDLKTWTTIAVLYTF